LPVDLRPLPQRLDLPVSFATVHHGSERYQMPPTERAGAAPELQKFGTRLTPPLTRTPP
jgi:hypothetical protein